MNDLLPICTNQFIGTDLNELYPFGLIAHGYACLAKEKRLLLHAATICQNQLTMVEQPDHFKISNRVNQTNIKFQALLSDERMASLISVMGVPKGLVDQARLADEL